MGVAGISLLSVKIYLVEEWLMLALSLVLYCEYGKEVLVKFSCINRTGLYGPYIGILCNFVGISGKIALANLLGQLYLLQYMAFRLQNLENSSGFLHQSFFADVFIKLSNFSVTFENNVHF